VHLYALTFVVRSANRVAARSHLRPSAPVIRGNVVGSAINPPPQDFFQNPPPTRKVAPCAVADPTLRSSVRRSERWLCQMLFATCLSRSTCRHNIQHRASHSSVRCGYRQHSQPSAQLHFVFSLKCPSGAFERCKALLNNWLPMCMRTMGQ